MILPILSLVAWVAQDGAPWQTDVPAARQAALNEGKPCVIILHVDSAAH